MTVALGLAQALMLATALQAGPQATSTPVTIAGAQNTPPQAARASPTPRLVSRRAEAWTWTLYSGEGPLVLANEIPDTPRLRTTLECTPGSSVARLTFYDATGSDGYARVQSGAASAEVETRSRRGRLEAALRADHPVFAAFMASGRLSLAAGDQAVAIDIDRANLPKLRRFAELCTG